MSLNKGMSNRPAILYCLRYTVLAPNAADYVLTVRVKAMRVHDAIHV